LRHVQEHDAHHEVRAPVVHGSKEPTELLMVIVFFKLLLMVLIFIIVKMKVQK
jgi:hypothetical protein